MESLSLNWLEDHILKISTDLTETSDTSELDPFVLRRKIEPWLSAVFQSDHLSLLVGAGLTNAVAFAAGIKPQDMSRLVLSPPFDQKIKEKADEAAKRLGRGDANIEDDIRISQEVINGLRLIGDDRFKALEEELNAKLAEFIKAILKCERDLKEKYAANEDEAINALGLLRTFVLSFASRTASRERLNLFTTNYDRFLEVACDEVGVLLLDRFKGKLLPIFRNTRLELDYHYNPPGIRGEPRYVEGVCRITKLHGSIDWRFDGKRVLRALLPFGADDSNPEVPEKITDKVVIYPNSSKDVETSYYPYAELFRDYSSAVCQQNSVLVTYGYGFGDSHINRVIEDMMTIPSTHLVVIAWDMNYGSADEKDFGGARTRIRRFLSDKNPAQVSLLVGKHFGDLSNLVNYYLPKAAIDRLTARVHKIREARGEAFSTKNVEAETVAETEAEAQVPRESKGEND